MTLRQIIYMVLDELKSSSDDAYYTEEHITFLVGKFRTFLLKQRYGTDIKKSVPESNYQTICLPIEEVSLDEGICYTGPRLVSSVEIPSMMKIGTRRLFPMDDFTSIHFTIVSRDRFNFIGVNSWMKNFIYATKGPDSRLYLKSGNPQYLYLEKVRLNAVFEDFEKASELECANLDENGECKIKDILDREFPMEDALVSPLIELIVKELAPALYRPEDSVNNAKDDLAKVGLATSK